MCNTDVCCSVKKGGVTSIEKSRGCTDILFLLLFVASWVVGIVIVQSAISAGGDPNKIVRGTNLEGKICGIDDAVLDHPLVAWPNPLYYSAKICVKSCAETNNIDSDYMARLYESHQFAHFCVPVIASNSSVTIDVTGFGNSFADGYEMYTRAVGDLETTYWVILGSGVIALIMVFVVIALMKKVAGVLVWSLLFLILLGGCFLGFTLHQWGLDAVDSPNPERADYLLYSSYGVIGLTAVFALVVCFLKTQISIAIEVVKEAADAVGDMKCVMFFPIIPFFLALAYFAFWITGALYIFSTSDLTQQDTPDEVREYGAEFHKDAGTLNLNPATMLSFKLESNQNWAAFHVFHLLWVAQFIFYFGYLVFAGATADWYFTPYDDNGDKIRGSGSGELTNSPVAASAYRTTRYHLGTVSVTALIIAIVQFARAVVLYIEEKTKSDPPNKVQRCMFACISCCLKCVECCMDKVNKNALIWTAIYGDGFATAACSSFALVWRNLARVAAISVVANVILFIGKLCVGLMTAGVAALIITNVSPYAEDVTSPLVPVVVVFALSYSVASVFFIIFDATIDTIFICFLIDNEVNEGGSMLASEGLQSLVLKHSVKSQEVAAKKHKIRSERPGTSGNESLIGESPGYGGM